MNLFAYGTLMCPDILDRVAACRPAYAPATLAGYRRYAVRNEVYPGIVEDHEASVRDAGVTAASVRGVVYWEVPEDAWRRLDRFEGEMYARRSVRALLEDGTSTDAATYVVKAEFTHRLTASEWSYEEFLRSGKRIFEARYPGFDA